MNDQELIIYYQEIEDNFNEAVVSNKVEEIIKADEWVPDIYKKAVNRWVCVMMCLSESCNEIDYLGMNGTVACIKRCDQLNKTLLLKP